MSLAAAAPPGTAADISEAASFSEWKMLVSDSFVPLEASPLHPAAGHFAGRLTGRRLRELAIVQVDAMAHRVEDRKSTRLKSSHWE